MSALASSRSISENNRRPSTTSGAKPRGPSTRVAPKDRPFSSGEVIPEDSASNAPPRRSVSDAQKVNGSIKASSERQTARVHLATRDNLQVRTRSPVKAASGDDAGEGSPRGRFPVHSRNRSGQGPAPVLRKRRKNLREFGESIPGHMVKVLISRFHSTMDTTGFPHRSYNSPLGNPHFCASPCLSDSRISGARTIA